MTTTTLAPPPAVAVGPAIGTPAYAAAAAWLLAHTADAWAVSSLVIVRAGQYGVEIQVSEDPTAGTIAATLGITGEPVHSTGAGYHGYTRAGAVDGIQITIASWWVLDQDSEARA